MTAKWVNKFRSYFIWLQNRFMDWMLSRNWVLSRLESSQGKSIKEFMNDLGMVFLYKVIGCVFTAVISILAAQLLCPSGYGEINLVNNISNILLLPMMVGINSSMYKYLPDSLPRQNDRLKTAALIGNFILMGLFSLFYFQIGIFVKNTVKIGIPIWQMGILATIVLDLYILSESFMRGQKKYLALARLKVAGSFIFFLLFLFWYYFQTMDFDHYFYAFFAAQVLFVMAALYKSDFHSFSLSGSAFKQIYHYGSLNMLNNLLIILISSSDFFIVNYFYPGRDLGIYSIYQGFVRGLFSIMFYEVFAVVFLPAISRANKNRLFHTIQRFVPLLWLIIVLLTAGFTTVVVLLSGKEYPLNPGYILLTASAIGFYAIFQIYNSIFTMEGNQGAKFCLIPLIFTIPVALLIQYHFTRYFGITGTMYAVMMTNLLLVAVFVVMLHWLKRVLKLFP